MTSKRGQLTIAAGVALAMLGWIALPPISYSQATTGGQPTSAKQGNPNGPQATNNAVNVPKTKAKQPSTPAPSTPKKTPPKAKPTPKSAPRITIGLGKRQRHVPNIGGQSQRFSLRLRLPLARTASVRGTSRMNVRPGMFSQNSQGSTPGKPKPKPKPGGGGGTPATGGGGGGTPATGGGGGGGVPAGAVGLPAPKPR